MLKGVTHIHSTYSFDGTLDLQELRLFFEARGLDFVLMSEHIEELNLQKIRSFIADCGKFSSEKCLLVPGIEMDELNIVIFGIREAGEYESVSDLAAQFQGQGALVVLSHPVKIRRELRPGVREMLGGVEVWNNRYDGKVVPRIKNLDLLRSLRLENPQLVALSGLDFHKKSDFAPVWIEVDASERTSSAILRGIRAGCSRICRNGRPIPIYGQNGRIHQAIFHLQCSTYAPLYDFTVRRYRHLKSLGIPVPAFLKRVVKRVF